MYFEMIATWRKDIKIPADEIDVESFTDHNMFRNEQAKSNNLQHAQNRIILTWHCSDESQNVVKY